MHERFCSVIFALAMTMWPVQLAHASSLGFTLASDTLFGGQGGVVAVKGTLTNTDAADVFLNGVLSFISLSGLTVDDQPFFLNTPLFLSPGESFTGEVFAVDIEPQAAVGTYQGSFTIQGGADANAFDTLSSVTFAVQVAIDTTPPTLTVSTNPTTLWPPDGKMVPVTISGTITDTATGINASTAAYAVTDEYGQVQPQGSVPLQPNGNYSFTIQLQASRNGNDQDGRQYTITISAQDKAGNPGSAVTHIIVPHDQGH
jgi:hypothetical protein